MNRRTAIKKIGTGGLVAATATTVSSSPAFAYDAPTQTSQPTIAVGAGGTTANVTVSPGSASCPLSATTTSATVVATTTTLTGTTIDTPFTFFGPRIAPGRLQLFGSTLPQTTTLTSFVVQRQAFFFFFWLNTDYLAGDTLQAAIEVRYRCTYSDATVRDLVVNQTRTASFNGTTWIVS